RQTISNGFKRIATDRMLFDILPFLSNTIYTKLDELTLRIETGFGITLYRGFQVSQGTQGLVAQIFTTNQFYWGCAIGLNRKLKLITNSPFPIPLIHAPEVKDTRIAVFSLIS
ncbi:hypothetical protein QUA13_30780, partial [Microcoleus sp. S28C3]|uniref:hypothetical protein n=1 Tax=Microcoleus sp. S28C3 TaxID=3055414 RepID=UPI002FD69EDA